VLEFGATPAFELKRNGNWFSPGRPSAARSSEQVIAGSGSGFDAVQLRLIAECQKSLQLAFSEPLFGGLQNE
jgi:hypothetical protein